MPITGMPRPLRLPTEKEVHVWTVLVSEYSDFLSDLQCLLSPEETYAAGRFVYAADRVRYTVSHGLLRRLLGEYLSLPPAGLKFIVAEFGKPALAVGAGQTPVCFNMAHSGDVVVYGITLGRRVGVDVEAIRPEVEVMNLARQQFSEAEAEALATYSPAERLDAFYRGWTRKEAYLKARGEGLGYPLNHFTVSLEVSEKPELRWVKDEPDAPERWSLFHLNSPAEYAAAVAVEGRPIELQTFRGQFF